MKTTRATTFAGTALLALVTPLLFWTFTEDIFLLPKTVFLIAVGAPLAAFHFHSRVRWAGHPPLPVWTASALLLHAAAGVAFSRLPAVSATAALPFLSACGFFIVVAGTAWTETERRRLLLLVCFAALATSVFGIAEHFGSDPLFDKIPRLAETADERKVMRAFLGHADYVGAFLAIALPMMCVLAFVEKRPLERFFAAASSALSLAAMLLTMTRASWLAALAAAGFLAFCVALRGGWKRFLKLSAAGAALIVVFFAVFSAFGVSEGETMLTRLLSAPDISQGASATRLSFWGTTLTAWRHAPAAGHGLGAFAWIFPKYQPEFIAARGAALGLAPAMNVTYAHNDFLQAAAETGAAGLLLLFAAGAGVFFVGMRRVLRGETREAALAAGCLAALVAALADAALMFPFRLAATGVYIALAAGLAVSPGAEGSARDLKERVKPWSAAALLCLALAVAGVGAAWCAAGRAVAADALLLRPARGDYAARLRRAREINPLDGEISFRLGRELYFGGKFEEALREFKKAEKYYDSPVMSAYEARAYKLLGDEASARARAKEATDNGYPPERIGR